LGEKTHCRNDPNIAKKNIGPLQIAPKSWNIAEKQIDLFFCLVEGEGA
jgi:hypothetical protein